MIRTIKIDGPFTRGDLIEVITLVRNIDRRGDGKLFTVTIVDADGTMDEGEKLLRDALLPLPDRATEFVRVAYKKETS